MHRHGYKGRKFGREVGPRTALIKNLADSLIANGSISTTLPKAKETLPYVEKLITKAKVGDLASRRQILSALMTESSAHKLVDDIAPRLKSRTSGYLRITKSDLRRGDNAPMAKISFVDDIKAPFNTLDQQVKPQPKITADKKAKVVKDPTTKVSKK